MSGYRALRVLSGNMDQLVALGTTAAYGYSAYLWWAGFQEHLYLEGAATVITLVLLENGWKGRLRVGRRRSGP